MDQFPIFNIHYKFQWQEPSTLLINEVRKTSLGFFINSVVLLISKLSFVD